ncbi:hypothetical protein KUA55_10590 [Enterococcus sp. ALS3]|uniref:Beta-1,6-galactofuranosyltransferase n=1 Tax=Enterococcus alishanensis TaxID=1303817 RepID=A0ABS6TDX1_9ENTE|nr:hypothetical protein [Enterococcus alishanensis]MBV7391129.1 hypothetical protein [Enterococcus alishanensis]
MTIYCSKTHSNTIPYSFAYWHLGASGKAHYDISEFTREIGGKDLDFYEYNDTNETNAAQSSRIDGILSGIKTNDIIIIQYPFLGSERYRKLLFSRAKLMGAKIVLFIHDIAAWRESNDHQAKSNFQFENADGFIFHSPAMQEQIIQQYKVKKEAQMVIQGLFGYKLAYLNGKSRSFSRNIDFAGSFSKSNFLTHIPESVSMTVFSNLNEPTLELPTNITLGDSYDPESIPFQLNGSFGLSWTSDSYPEVTGSYGLYEKYNMPHKLSLYLAANQPVIVWDQSAEADFIVKNNIGRTISNLEELPKLLDSFTEEDYQEMYQNVIRIGQLVREGFWFKKALFDIQDKLLVK